MVFVPFPEYRPDVSSYNANVTGLVSNVLPRQDGYGPFHEFGALTQTLGGGNDSFTKVLLHFDGTDASTTITDDAAGAAFTWTAAGNAQIDTAQSVFGGASLLCDGTGDWVSSSVGSALPFLTDDFHIHMRVRCAGADGTLFNICGQGDSTASATLSSFNIARISAGNVIRARVSDGASFVTLTGVTAVLQNVWHEIEFSRSGGTLYLFVDGNLEASDAVFAGNTVSDDLRVGAAGELTTNTWNGWIDEFMLSMGEAGHTAEYNPPESAYSIPTPCRGMFYARDDDGTIVVFAGSVNKLFKLNATTQEWADVSVAAGYTDLPANNHWQFAQFGLLVIAVQPNAAPQVFTLGSSTAFGNLSGSPPQAAYIAIVSRFVVLSGLTSNPFRIQWSGLGDATNWTAGSNSSDFQDFPDGGIVRGVASGDFGIVFQDSVIRRMIWNQNTVTVFDFNKITEEMGLLYPYSLTKAGDSAFFVSQKGWHRVGLTGSPVAIGKERVDRTFFADVDVSSPRLVVGAGDPEASRAFFMYKSGSGAAGLADKLLAYDYLLDRWSAISGQALEYIATMSVPGVTLEGLDALFPNLDAMTISLDDIAQSALPRLAAFDSTNAMGMFTGETLEAILETPEQATDIKVRIQNVRPNTDATTCYVSIGVREKLSDAVTYRGETVLLASGICGANVRGRLLRARLRIPAGETWTFASGVEPRIAGEGRW